VIEFSFFCPNCSGKVHGIAIEKASADTDEKCYSCGADWEKVIVDRTGEKTQWLKK
jgi:DNA-directed RNA polymerase subunit RPC12/RpoP